MEAVTMGTKDTPTLSECLGVLAVSFTGGIIILLIFTLSRLSIDKAFIGLLWYALCGIVIGGLFSINYKQIVLKNHRWIANALLIYAFLMLLISSCVAGALVGWYSMGVR